MTREAPRNDAAEVTWLRDCVDNLAGIMALPAQWTGSEPAEIVNSLVDALLGMLRLGFVFVRLHDAEGGRPIETMRVAESLQGEDINLSVAAAFLGLRGEIGTVAAGSARSDFPTPAERLVLDVAANQAALGLLQGRRRRDAERNSRLLVDSIPGLVALLTPAGEVEFVNRQILEYTGRTLDDLKQWGTNDTVHAQDLPQVIQAFTQAIASGSPYGILQRLRRADGAYLWFQNNGFPLRDASGTIDRWCVLLTDVDDRKRAEEELKRSEAFLLEGQRLARIGNFVWRMTAGEISWSDEVYRMFEFTPGTPVTLERVASRVHPEDLPMLQEMVERAQRGDNYFEYQHRLLMPDTSVKHLHLIAHAVRDEQHRLEYIGAVQDVTRRRVAEEALDKARSQLAQVARVATVSTLTASIAHEINQPLAGIITNAGTCLRMLDATPPNIDGARETARRTIRDGNRASDVITRLRTLFSKQELTREPLDLNEATREVIALSSTDLQGSRIVLQLELADGLPVVAGDRVQIQQVILNLLRNAVDAMGDVQDRPRHLLIRTEWREPDGVRLTVRDAGVGLQPEHLNTLFDPFYSTKRGGMGIGLFVSRSIVETHHGRLWAKPNDGEPGATFSFSIPRDTEDHADPAFALRTS